jgi:NitT/TauT family transport system ATP-binding protein
MPDIGKACSSRDSAKIRIRSLGKTFTSGNGESFEALHDIDLDIGHGEFISLLGPSGCGKSTLLRIIAGLEPPSRGTVEVEGKPLRGTPPGIGMVFQHDVLLDWRNVINNVLLPVEFAGERKRDYSRRALDILALYGLKGFEQRYPWELSGGMRQRVAICRALIRDPAFLMMDEPFGALDALTRDELNIELQSLWMRTKKSVLFVTHGIAEAVFLSDRVIVMATRPGRIVDILPVDLPRPRTFSLRAGKAFGEYTDRIREVFEAYEVFRSGAR